VCVVCGVVWCGVVWCGVCGGGGGGGGGARDTESKTRTPHKDVGNKAHGFGICFYVQSPNICDPKSSFSKNKDLASGKWFLQESLLTRNFLKRFKKKTSFSGNIFFLIFGEC